MANPKRKTRKCKVKGKSTKSAGFVGVEEKEKPYSQEFLNDIDKALYSSYAEIDDSRMNPGQKVLWKNFGKSWRTVCWGGVCEQIADAIIDDEQTDPTLWETQLLDMMLDAAFGKGMF